MCRIRAVFGTCMIRVNECAVTVHCDEWRCYCLIALALVVCVSNLPLRRHKPHVEDPRAVTVGWISYEAARPDFVFILYYSNFWCTGACHYLNFRLSFFSAMLSDWLGRVSLKWRIFVSNVIYKLSVNVSRLLMFVTDMTCRALMQKTLKIRFSSGNSCRYLWWC